MENKPLIKMFIEIISKAIEEKTPCYWNYESHGIKLSGHDVSEYESIITYHMNNTNKETLFQLVFRDRKTDVKQAWFSIDFSKVNRMSVLAGTSGRILLTVDDIKINFLEKIKSYGTESDN